MEYQTSKHCKYLLLYHIVLVTKYRHSILVKLGELVKSLIKDLECKYSFTIETMEVDIDHVHLLISTSPDINLKYLVIQIKREITIRVYQISKDMTKYLRKYYWYKNKIFSEGYFICSIGDASEDTIRRYIESQG